MAAAGASRQPAVHAARVLGHLHHGAAACATPGLAWSLSCLMSKSSLYPGQLTLPGRGWGLCVT